MAGGPLITASPEDQERARAAIKRLSRAGITYREQAEWFGVHLQYVTMFANGIRPVPDRVVDKVAGLAPRPCAVPDCTATSGSDSPTCDRHCVCMVGEPCPDDSKTPPAD